MYTPFMHNRLVSSLDIEDLTRVVISYDFFAFEHVKVDIFSVKIYIVVTDVVNDITFSRKSVNTRVVITLFIT